MAHVTFIHGIGNKPEAEELHRIWLRTLADGGLGLVDEGVTSSLVYWADVLYPEPDRNVAAFESALESRAEGVDAAGGADAPAPETPEERAFLEGLRGKLTAVPPGAAAPAADALDATPAVGQLPLERIPLPWALKERFLETFLRDVHAYLFDVEVKPRPGATYRVQQEIRRRFVDALGQASVSAPHIVVSHSMGTVVAYDCLKRVGGCPRVDALVTIGSPLGIDEVQDKLRPEWRRHDGFPSLTVAGAWINVADPLDVVCGPDPKLGNDYRLDGRAVVNDLRVTNSGWWRHGIVQYLRQTAVVRELGGLLGF
jgi:hypothetical protein